MRVDDTIEGARRSAVTIVDQHGEARGSGLLLDLGSDGVWLLTCFHLVAAIPLGELQIRRGMKTLSNATVTYMPNLSQPERDIAVLRVHKLRINIRPALKRIDTANYDGSLLEPASAITGAAQTFEGRLGLPTSVEVPAVPSAEGWTDAPISYVLPHAIPLRNPTDARRGISGSVVTYSGGVVGLVNAARPAQAGIQREVYVMPLGEWAAAWPLLNKFLTDLAVRKPSSDDALKLTYLNRVWERSRRLMLSAVDVKAAVDQPLNLDAIYTRLLVKPAEYDQRSSSEVVSKLIAFVRSKVPADEDNRLRHGSIWTRIPSYVQAYSLLPDVQKIIAGHSRNIAEAGILDKLLHEAREEQTPDSDVIRFAHLLFTIASGRESALPSALSQLVAHERLVLMGDPGSGKSTFANFVTLCMAGELLGQSDANLTVLGRRSERRSVFRSADDYPFIDDGDDDDEEWIEKITPSGGPQFDAKLPILVTLRDFAARGLPVSDRDADVDDLWKFIIDDLGETLEPFAMPLRTLLAEEGGILILDGLDEVPSAENRRDQIRQAIESFEATFPRVRLLVTSRTYAYRNQDWKLNGFAECELAPFDSAQIAEFIARWYDHLGKLRGLSPEDSRGRARLLTDAVLSRPSLRSLAERPLLLTLMSSLHAWRGGALPERRAELYADAVELLLNQWERARIVFGEDGSQRVIQPSLLEWLRADRAKLLTMLYELAFTAHARQPDTEGSADINEGELIQGLLGANQNPDPDVRPARLVEYLRDRAALLVPRGVGVYAFPHRTFQEFLAACHLTEQNFPEEIVRLTRSDPDRWREVALLCAARAGQGSSFATWAFIETMCPDEPPNLPANSAPADDIGAEIAAGVLLDGLAVSKLADRDERRRQRVCRWQLYRMRRSDVPVQERASAGELLWRLGDIRPTVRYAAEIEMCYVPAGPFLRGAARVNRFDRANSPVEVELPYNYWISRYPLTLAHMLDLAQDDADLQRALAQYGAHYRVGSRPGSLPAHAITWTLADRAAKILTRRLQEDGRWGKDRVVALPSEDEWEKAARGGLMVPDPVCLSIADTINFPTCELKNNPLAARKFPWGSQAKAVLVNCKPTEYGDVTPVGCFPNGSSPYGVEEMCGNVWEFTRDAPKPKDEFEVVSLYDVPLEFGASGEPVWLEPKPLALGSDGLRVVRGGAYDSPISWGSCSARIRAVATEQRSSDIGVRLVVVPSRQVSS